MSSCSNSDQRHKAGFPGDRTETADTPHSLAVCRALRSVTNVGSPKADQPAQAGTGTLLSILTPGQGQHNGDRNT